MTTLLQVLVNLSYIILFASLLAQIVLRSDTRIACNLSAAIALLGSYFLYDPEATQYLIMGVVVGLLFTWLVLWVDSWDSTLGVDDVEVMDR